MRMRILTGIAPAILISTLSLSVAQAAKIGACESAFTGLAVKVSEKDSRILVENGVRWVREFNNHNQDPRVIPQIMRAETRDKARVDYSGIKAHIIKLTEAYNKGKPQSEHVNPAELTATIVVSGIETPVMINGVKTMDIPWSESKAIVPEAASGQVDYYVIFKDKSGTVRHQSRWAMREAQSHELQTLAPGSYTGRSSGERFRIFVSKTLEKLGMKETLTETAVRLFNKKVVWDLTENASPATREFVKNATSGVDVVAKVGGKGKVVSVTIRDRATGKKIAAQPEEISRKVDAAFSTNRFAWDDAIVAESRVEHDPQIAAETLTRYFDLQEANGGVVPRENRANGTSLWFPFTVEYPLPPRPNLTFTNPYLFHQIATKLYNFHPNAKNLALLKRAAKSVDDYAAWMEKHRSIKDDKGEIIGFNGSALGSGLDNSRGNVGNANEQAGHERGFVDYISQHISMYKESAKWNKEFAEKTSDANEKRAYAAKSKELHEKAKRFARILNENYWDASRNFYFDIIPDGKGGYKRDTRWTAVSGFWPLYAAAVPKARVEAMVKAHMNPESFGGNVAFPSNSRQVDYWKQVAEEGIHLEYTPRKDGNGKIVDHGYHDHQAIWNPNVINFAKGLERSGRPDLAYQVMRDFLAAQAEYSTKTVEEAYGVEKIVDENGQTRFKLVPLAHGSHPHREDFAGWGASPATGVQLELVLGLKATAKDGLELNMRTPLEIGNQADALGTENIQTAGGTLRHLSVRRIGPTTFEITSKSDKPVDFRLSTLLNSKDVITSETTAASEKIRLPGGNGVHKVVVDLKPVAQ